jgi:hypothetical protein
MAKFKIQKGDKIEARSSALISENHPFEKIGGHNVYDKPLTVTKVFSHGVRTKEMGYIHNNNIISKSLGGE